VQAAEVGQRDHVARRRREAEPPELLGEVARDALSRGEADGEVRLRVLAAQLCRARVQPDDLRCVAAGLVDERALVLLVQRALALQHLLVLGARVVQQRLREALRAAQAQVITTVIWL
jgi:hypothetical protein